MSVLTLLVCTIIALFTADLFSGLVHWGTDTWLDEISWPRTILIAREHHLHPHHIVGYGLRDYLAFSAWPTVVAFALPVLLLTLAVEPTPFVFATVCVIDAVAVIMIFGTYAHRLGHRRTKIPMVRWLQRAHLLIDTRHHGVHHSGGHDRRYCVINGWANHVCDAIGFWRALERLVQWVTGAVPRANDRVWFARFAADRYCLVNTELPGCTDRGGR
jgi:plasmanylethanolamine desaturase